MVDSRLSNIYQVNAADGRTAQLLPFRIADHPVAVAYDSTSKSIYWTDFTHHAIFKYSLTTNTSTVVYTDPSNTGKIRLLNIRLTNYAVYSSQRLQNNMQTIVVCLSVPICVCHTICRRLVSVCLSVYLSSQSGIVSKRLDVSSWVFWHGGFFSHILHCVITKFGKLHK